MGSVSRSLTAGATGGSTSSDSTDTSSIPAAESTRSVSVAYLLVYKVRVNLVDQLLVILEMK
uniref:Uncharacterized protein n=1 Tax=Picea glauca TaxID=3330 RepID=A0A101M040_PICGL|nr:hypothetical protein ABT39_MTgene5388 [Picea glauca]QHR91088.1 hypothetical protein Q903MT_gene5120 [Picea sitchensis]